MRTHNATAKSLGDFAYIFTYLEVTNGMSLLKQQHCNMNYHSKLGDNIKFIIIIIIIINAGKVGS